MRLRLLPYLAIAIFLISLSASGQTHPTSLCADVSPTGEVLLSWEDADAVSSTQYEIYRDQGAGFTGPLIPAVGFPDLSFLDAGANADLDMVRYFIIDRDAPSSAVPDTISTILLELIPTGSASVAQLEWNSPFSPMPLGGEFIVERSSDGTAFAQMATLPPTANLYLDTLYSECELKEFTYRVKYEIGSCSMTSQEITGEFEDDEGPTRPVVETITVDPLTGFVTIYWTPSPEPDVADYEIQNVDAGIYEEIGTLPASSESFSLDLSQATDPVTWVVIARDDCGNEESFEGEHTTIEANATYLDCQDFVTIDWSAYAGWQEGISGYEIRAILADGTDTLMGTTDPDGFISNVSVNPNVEYTFYVAAISNGTQRPSTSNGVRITTVYPPISRFYYLSSVSTNLTDQIEVKLYQDTAGVGTSYQLYKKADEGSFNLIATRDAIPGEETITYIDSDVRANELVYTYFWTAIDGCGVPIGDSNEGKNIVLSSGTNKNNLINRLSWTKYEDWDGTVSEYQIFRGLGAEEPFFYDAADGATTDWSEDVEVFLMNQGRFCYRIQAVESANQFGPGATSFSNLSCLTQDPLIWIPTAMVFEGFNDQFKPVLGFIDFETYRMEIYNKWGERLFEASDIEIGWDGTFDGNVVPEDYYRYIIGFKDGAGKPYVEEGRMYMVRNAE